MLDLPSNWMPPNAALHGFAVDRLMRWNLAAMLACFVAAHIWLIYAMVRRTRTSPAEHLPNRASTRKLPPAGWGLLFLLCAMYIWMAITAQRLWAANRFEGPSPEAMQVEVVGQQFQWYFRYPGDDAKFGITQPALVNAAAGNPLGLDHRDPSAADDLVSSVLTLPAGREVDLRLRSLDVIHGLFIPGMRLKQNAVPGLILHVHFTPVAVGTYPILCSQVCGLGHQRMQAEMRVVSEKDYRDWLTAQQRLHAREVHEEEQPQ